MVIRAFYWAFLSFFLAHVTCLDFVFSPLFAAESLDSSQRKEKKKLKEEDDEDDIEGQRSNVRKKKNRPAHGANSHIDLILKAVRSALENAQGTEFDEEEQPSMPSTSSQHNLSPVNFAQRLFVNPASHDPIYQKVKKVSKRTKEQHTQTQKKQAAIINRQNYSIVTTIAAGVLIIVIQWIIDNYTSSSHK